MLGPSPIGRYRGRQPSGTIDTTRHPKQTPEFVSLTICYKCQKLHRTDRPCPIKNRPAHTIKQTFTEVYRQLT